MEGDHHVGGKILNAAKQVCTNYWPLLMISGTKTQNAKKQKRPAKVSST
jgi:hypothetical protein